MYGARQMTAQPPDEGTVRHLIDKMIGDAIVEIRDEVYPTCMWCGDDIRGNQFFHECDPNRPRKELTGLQGLIDNGFFDD